MDELRPRQVLGWRAVLLVAAVVLVAVAFLWTPYVLFGAVIGGAAAGLSGGANARTQWRQILGLQRNR